MKVGLQTYSVREELARTPKETLKAVADMGYKYLETCLIADFPTERQALGMTAKEAGAFLKENGMVVVGAHITSQTDMDALGPIFAYNAAIGNTKVGLSAHFFQDREDLLRKCEIYNETGRFAKKQGMVFYYHNHFHEFQYFGDKTVMDILLENTDPELVSLELDTFWAARGGADPAKLIEKYKDRLILLHQKDFNREAGEPLDLFREKVDIKAEITRDVYINARKEKSFAEVGTGTLPIQDYIDAGNRAGVPYLLLEQDFTFLNQIESVRISMDSFRKYTGISWN